PEHRAVGDRGQPEQRTWRQLQRTRSEGRRDQWPQSRRRLPAPDLTRHPMPQRLGIDRAAQTIEPDRARRRSTGLEQPDRQRGGEPPGSYLSVDRLAQYALPRHGHPPDREVVGRLVGRLRSVRIAAGKVEAVSEFEGEIEQWVAELVE